MRSLGEKIASLPMVWFVSYLRPAKALTEVGMSSAHDSS